jgi:hypothetical protein
VDQERFCLHRKAGSIKEDFTAVRKSQHKATSQLSTSKFGAREGLHGSLASFAETGRREVVQQIMARKFGDFKTLKPLIWHAQTRGWPHAQI